jgi:protein O-GlcNAc transferase
MTARRPEIDEALDLIGAGDLARAQDVLVKVLQADQRDGHAWRVLANIRYLVQDLPNAAQYTRNAAACAPPGDADFWWNLARVAACFDNRGYVEQLFRRALAVQPSHLDASVGLSAALSDQSRFADVVAVVEAALKQHPGHPGLRFNRAQALLNLGRAERTVAESQALARDFPGDPNSDILLSYVSNFARGITPEESIASHRRMGTLIASKVGDRPRPARRARAAGEPLRVGFLSSDLRVHSVSYFVECLFRQLDRRRFFIVAYMTSAGVDQRTKVFESLADRWHLVATLEDQAVAELIERDQIDILIDLNGQTGGWLPGILARRPAPLLGTYCGYPNTTGLEAVDFRIVDTLTDPAGAEAWCVERLVRIDPCFLCYTPPADAPAVEPGPASRGEPVTFGSFNNLTKTNDQTLALWAKVVSAVPGSRLVIKTMPLVDPRVREDLASRLRAVGLPESSFLLMPPLRDTGSHLRTYGRIDISLDTFPYHGTTTTCESLLMGVPVVSLTGTTHASRVGLSLLTASGNPEWAAKDEGEYVAKAVELASDRARLIELRMGLRGRLLASALCDGAAMAARFGAALEAEWARSGA